MTQPDPRAVRTLFEQVQAILHRGWDPLQCGAPLDEYDSYAWPVVKLLQQHAPREEIARYLRWAADEAMTSPVAEDRLAAVIDSLMKL